MNVLVKKGIKDAQTCRAIEHEIFGVPANALTTRPQAAYATIPYLKQNIANDGWDFCGNN
jgi:hypothetical protein